MQDERSYNQAKNQGKAQGQNSAEKAQNKKKDPTAQNKGGSQNSF